MSTRRSSATELGFVAVVAALGLTSLARAAEVPALLPGRVATMAGSHVSCKAAAASVTCKKIGGLTATISLTGVVHVIRNSRTLTSAGKPRVLRPNAGFNVLGTQGVGVYCHVYVAGKPTLDCSLDDPVRVRNSHGFDMTDASVVVFRYDASGLRHDVKSLRQP